MNKLKAKILSFVLCAGHFASLSITAFGSFGYLFSTAVFSDCEDFSAYTKNVVSEMKYFSDFLPETPERICSAA